MPKKIVVITNRVNPAEHRITKVINTSKGTTPYCYIDGEPQYEQFIFCEDAHWYGSLSYEWEDLSSFLAKYEDKKES